MQRVLCRHLTKRGLFGDSPCPLLSEHTLFTLIYLQCTLFETLCLSVGSEVDGLILWARDQSESRMSRVSQCRLACGGWLMYSSCMFSFVTGGLPTTCVCFLNALSGWSAVSRTAVRYAESDDILERRIELVRESYGLYIARIMDSYRGVYEYSRNIYSTAWI